MFGLQNLPLPEAGNVKLYTSEGLEAVDPKAMTIWKG